MKTTFTWGLANALIHSDLYVWLVTSKAKTNLGVAKGQCTTKFEKKAIATGRKRQGW